MLKKIGTFSRLYPWATLFAVFILLYTALDFAVPDRERSEMENRPLAARPALSWSALMNGKYDEDYDEYVNDQFLARDFWVTLKSFTESFLLKVENNGVVYGKEGYMFAKYDQLNTKNPTRPAENEAYVREFFALYPQTPFTFILIPNAYVVMPDKLPYGLQMVDQKAYMKQYYTGLGQHVQTLDLLPALREKAESYLYYRTDHHWTTHGAYIAARAYADSRGLRYPSPEQLVRREELDFYGTNFSHAKKAAVRPDTITWFDIPVTSVTVAGEKKEGLYQFAQFDTRDKYAAFLWGNNNFTAIRSENNLNPQAGKKTRALLIKDSYGNCFAPFLTYLYDEVDVVDLRFLGGMKEYMGTAYDDVILMYNFESFSTDAYLARLRY